MASIIHHSFLFFLEKKNLHWTCFILPTTYSLDYTDTVVKYALGGLDENLFVQKYHVQLPTEEDLKRFIAKGIHDAEENKKDLTETK